MNEERILTHVRTYACWEAAALAPERALLLRARSVCAAHGGHESAAVLLSEKIEAVERVTAVWNMVNRAAASWEVWS